MILPCMLLSKVVHLLILQCILPGGLLLLPTCPLHLCALLHLSCFLLPFLLFPQSLTSSLLLLLGPQFLLPCLLFPQSLTSSLLLLLGLQLLLSCLLVAHGLVLR